MLLSVFVWFVSAMLLWRCVSVCVNSTGIGYVYIYIYIWKIASGEQQKLMPTSKVFHFFHLTVFTALKIDSYKLSESVHMRKYTYVYV